MTNRALLLVGLCEIIPSDWERDAPSRRLSHLQFLANKLDAHPSTKSFLLNSFCKVLLIHHLWLLLYLTPGNNQPVLEQLSKAGVSTRDRILGLSIRKGLDPLSVPPTHTDLGKGVLQGAPTFTHQQLWREGLGSCLGPSLPLSSFAIRSSPTPSFLFWTCLLQTSNYLILGSAGSRLWKR